MFFYCYIHKLYISAKLRVKSTHLFLPACHALICTRPEFYDWELLTIIPDIYQVNDKSKHTSHDHLALDIFDTSEFLSCIGYNMYMVLPCINVNFVSSTFNSIVNSIVIHHWNVYPVIKLDGLPLALISQQSKIEGNLLSMSWKIPA